jgi:cytoskeletal protein CcmA (bactofilin family)
VLSERARVEGEIRVSHAVINGTVVGPVYGTQYVELQSKCKVSGDVHYRTLEIQLGAVVQGRLVHQEEASGRAKFRWARPQQLIDFSRVDPRYSAADNFPML